MLQYQGELDFSGATYEAAFDHDRLKGQLRKIYDLMADGIWRTLPEIETATGYGQASISAQLRNLRKPKFGGHTIDKRTRGDRALGLYEYRLFMEDKNAGN